MIHATTKAVMCGPFNDGEVWFVRPQTKVILERIYVHHPLCYAVFEVAMISNMMSDIDILKPLVNASLMRSGTTAVGFYRIDSKLADHIQNNWNDLKMMHQVGFAPETTFSFIDFEIE